LYVDPSNPKEIASVIGELLSDKELMKNMSKLNKRLSQDEYNWQTRAKN